MEAMFLVDSECLLSPGPGQSSRERPRAGGWGPGDRKSSGRPHSEKKGAQATLRRTPGLGPDSGGRQGVPQSQAKTLLPWRACKAFP